MDYNSRRVGVVVIGVVGIVDVQKREWPDLASLVKLTLIAKKSPQSLVPKDWRPISNQEVGVKLLQAVLMEKIRADIARALPESDVVDRSQRLFSRFCSVGYAQECILGGGGAAMLLRLLRDRVERARREGTGLTVIFLDVSNGFGAVDHDGLLPAFLAMGVDRASAALLAFLYTSCKANLRGTVFDVVVGVTQGGPISPIVFALAQAVPFMASRPEIFNRFVPSYMDDSSGLFQGRTGRDSRRSGSAWLNGAVPLVGAFGFKFNPDKISVLSVEGRRGVIRFPLKEEWLADPVALQGVPLRLLVPSPWTEGPPAGTSAPFLGHTVRAADSGVLKREGLFDSAGRQPGKTYREALRGLMTEARKETLGLPCLVKIARFCERLDRVNFG